MTKYQNNLEGVSAADLEGFFQGWPAPPTAAGHYRILQNSDHVMLARDEESGRIVGFANALSDRILSAYIPLVEVRPEYRHMGIGRELIRRLLLEIGELYMIDLVCDENLRGFYQALEFMPARAMIRRAHGFQSGRP